jgi:hypothetical protein
MNHLSLSIEELIYCFYSEGFFEQGNALKQVYFGDLSDEHMDLVLQVTTRSLLAKNFLHYKNHKFSLVDELSAVISALNHSEQSIKLSRHGKEGNEETVSFHFSEGKIVEHSLEFDEQVHVFNIATLNDVVSSISNFYRVDQDTATMDGDFSFSQEEFEIMLDSLTENKKLFELPNLQGDKLRFYQTLKQTAGMLNTLLFLEYGRNNEPEAKNMILFTNAPEQNWIIEKVDDSFTVIGARQDAIKKIVLQNFQAKEIINNGK